MSLSTIYRVLFCISALLSCFSSYAASVVTQPGGIAGYMYFPASASVASSGGSSEITLDSIQTASTVCMTSSGDVPIPSGFTRGVVQAIVVGAGGAGGAASGSTAGGDSSISYATLMSDSDDSLGSYIGPVVAKGGEAGIYGPRGTSRGGAGGSGGGVPGTRSWSGGGGGYGGVGGSVPAVDVDVTWADYGAGGGGTAGGNGGGGWGSGGYAGVGQGFGYGGGASVGSGNLDPNFVPGATAFGAPSGTVGKNISYPSYIPCLMDDSLIVSRGASGFGAGGAGDVSGGGGGSGYIATAIIQYTGGTISVTVGAGGINFLEPQFSANRGLVALRFIPSS